MSFEAVVLGAPQNSGRLAAPKIVRRRRGSGRRLVAFSVVGWRVPEVAAALSGIRVSHRWLHPDPGAEDSRHYVLAVLGSRQAAKVLLACDLPTLEPRELRLTLSVLRRAFPTALRGRRLTFPRSQPDDL